MWRKFVHDYLSFTRQERRGIMVLCILILLCWCIPVAFKFFQRKIPLDPSSFQKEVALFHRQQDTLRQAQSSRYADETKNILNANEPPPPFPFDPNTLSAEGWLKLGIPAHEIKIIQHYLTAGGHFYRKEDLKKIYGFPPEIYDRLALYIHIKEPQSEYSNTHLSDLSSDKAGRHTRYPPKNHPAKASALDINNADSTDWVKIRGIGPVLSSRIIRFRKALGGFYDLNQISEVYGLPDSTLQQIKQQLKISAITLKKLNINKATVDELKSHPYISYRLAASIKAFRDQHGSYDSVEDLKQLQLVNDQIYRKLAPYLTVK